MCVIRDGGMWRQFQVGAKVGKLFPKFHMKKKVQTNGEKLKCAAPCWTFICCKMLFFSPARCGCHFSFPIRHVLFNFTCVSAPCVNAVEKCEIDVF